MDDDVVGMGGVDAPDVDTFSGLIVLMEGEGGVVSEVTEVVG